MSQIVEDAKELAMVHVEDGDELGVIARRLLAALRSRFCHSCGQAMIPADPPRFDGDTGEKINERCPTDDCRHRGRHCKYVGRWFPKCSMCGLPPYSW
jgi:hypothetical protein